MGRRPQRVSFVNPPTPRARLAQAGRSVGAFVRWLFSGELFGPSVRFGLLGGGLWLVLGAPARYGDAAPSLHGDERVIGAVIGVMLWGALVAYWRADR